jgi:FkbH-like protein
MQVESGPDAVTALQQAGSSLARLMPALRAREAELATARSVRFGISAAITADGLGLFLRKQAALCGLQGSVVQGGFDDPLGDMAKFAAEGVEQVVLLPFLDMLLPHLEAQAVTLAPQQVQDKLAEFTTRYQLTLQKAAGFAVVFVFALHRITGAPAGQSPDAVDRLLDTFNGVLRQLVQDTPNARWIDTASVIQRIGFAAAFDWRFYWRAKAPYSPVCLDAMAAALSVASRGFGSYFYKCVVVDCDNTLWGGVIGEDGLQGVKLDPYNYPGNVYWRVQQQLARLQAQGVLLCLCSKNNPADVQEMLEQHPAMVLKPAQIVTSKVNWLDKPTNLRAIADELNIGLDSLIFLDDSGFECNAVRSQLPQVRVLQVPANLPDYPALLDQATDWLLGGGVTGESQAKTEQYRLRAQALALQAEFSSQEDYLRSLQLKVILTRNARDAVARISELSQKSNQFNLTLRRYTEAAITRQMEASDSDVFSLVVKDRFGDSGLTGVVVMHYEGEVARVDNFFMSCRVIGRGVEQVIWACIAGQARLQGCHQLLAEFIPGPKNALVERFYDDLGLPRGTPHGTTVTYTFDLAAGKLPAADHIELTYVG